MANQEQLDILKQGVQAWNQWRVRHPDVCPDLTGADLRKADLFDADLSRTYLSRANLFGANLYVARLFKVDLSRANLFSANLSHAHLLDAYLTEADLTEARLSGANLRHANLSGANLLKADFTEANLTEANLTNAIAGWTNFGDTDLSAVKNLGMVQHRGPSTIGIDTIIHSQGNIPEIFLRGAGVPDSIIEAIPALIGSLKSIDYYSCFISYSSKDQAFAERVYADLRSKNVSCWYDQEDMKIGDKIRPRIEESIRKYDKLLLVLSEHSIASDWVAYEVERALNKEPQGIPNVLFPIRLDDAVMKSKAGWADDIKSTRHIGDFTLWKNHDDYQKAFTRLLRDLKAEA